MNPTIAVTGAGRGIGRSITTRFLREGWDVFALVRNADSVATLAADGSAKGKLKAIAFDAASTASVLEAGAQLAKDAPTLTALVNNAGIAMAAPLHKTALPELERLMAINFTAPFLLCQQLMPAMAKRGGGRVVNVASTAALKGFKYTSAYCASKHALLGMTRALAHEFAAKQVTVNAVCPGWVDTDMLAGSVDNIVKASGRTPEAAREALQQMNPQGRFVTPNEVADVVWVLAASDAGRSVTGAHWVIDGGETL
jgi:NAD(P)-dependent dehydrogenase (short-subunit alcohol dehydrogenase family)